MIYSQQPPERYEIPEVPLFFAKDDALWNLMWLFYPKMDILDDLRIRAETPQPLTDWLEGIDADLIGAIMVDLERSEFQLREKVTTLAPVPFMEWLWKQKFTELFIYQHVKIDGMHLATKRAAWLDRSAENPPAAQVIPLRRKA
jgi:hypothetical protein